MPPKLILDNMRIARIFSKGKEVDQKLTTLFRELSDHFKFDVRFCSPYCPNQKGAVENSVGILKNTFDESHINYFDSLEQVQEFIDVQINDGNHNSHHRKNDTIDNLFRHERCCFFPIPEREYTLMIALMFVFSTR